MARETNELDLVLDIEQLRQGIPYERKVNSLMNKLEIEWPFLVRYANQNWVDKPQLTAWRFDDSIDPGELTDEDIEVAWSLNKGDWRSRLADYGIVYIDSADFDEKLWDEIPPIGIDVQWLLARSCG